MDSSLNIKTELDEWKVPLLSVCHVNDVALKQRHIHYHRKKTTYIINNIKNEKQQQQQQ